MLDTDLKAFENDILEVVNLFSNAINLKIRHRATESEINSEKHKVVNTITINNKTYAYGNLITFKNEIEHKRLCKRYAKLSMYKALVAFTGEQYPWGALTGIRPTKLAYSQLSSCNEFEDFFQNVMLVSKEKTQLTKQVIASQQGIYLPSHDLEKDDFADLFIFIPFCPSRCSYCSFITSDIKFSAKYMDIYTKSLIREIEESVKLVKNIRSIYIGGGTPVCLSDENLTEILSTVDKYNKGVEFTVEAGRPDVISESKLEILKKFRVTRICINPQTFCDKTLKEIGRNHSSLDIEEKYNMSKNYFSINMDLIAGLKNESVEDFKFSIDKAINLSPDNITVHTLCIKRGSELSQDTNRLKICDIEQMIEYSNFALQQAGYKPYYLYRQKYMAGNLENVGWTKNNKACVYNIDTMEDCVSIIACGANAISKRLYNGGERIERLASPKDIKTYLDKIDSIINKKKKFFEKKLT